MSRKPKRYQHKVPQRPDEQLLPYHDVQPHHNDRRSCATCLQPIKAVDENDGPEALKSMFRM